MSETYYIVRVWDDGTEKFLFNRRTLVNDIALARHFSDLTPACHYMSKSVFTTKRHRIDAVVQDEPPVDPHNLGAIVE